MTSGECEEVDMDTIREILGNRSELILSEDVTSIDMETFRQLFRNHSEEEFLSDNLINCSNPYIMRMGDSQPLSEEAISWVLATLPMGAMV